MTAASRWIARDPTPGYARAFPPAPPRNDAEPTLTYKGMARAIDIMGS